MLLYTDGVTEAFNSKSEMYSEERLLENIKRLAEEPAQAVVNGLYESVKIFAGEEQQSDDITLLFCKYFGVD